MQFIHNDSGFTISPSEEINHKNLSDTNWTKVLYPNGGLLARTISVEESFRVIWMNTGRQEFVTLEHFTSI